MESRVGHCGTMRARASQSSASMHWMAMHKIAGSSKGLGGTGSMCRWTATFTVQMNLAVVESSWTKARQIELNASESACSIETDRLVIVTPNVCKDGLAESAGNSKGMPRTML